MPKPPSFRYVPELQRLSTVLSHLDCVVSLATAVEAAPAAYVKPTVLDETGEKRLVLREARHPVLEQMPAVSFIPNDFNVEGDLGSFSIITGPNLGENAD